MSAPDRLRRWMAVQLATLLGLMEWAEEKGEAITNEFVPADTRGQTGAILSVVVVGIVMLVGVLIFSQIQTSLPQPSNNELQDASDNVTSGFADAMELAPVILIVLIASIVLAIVQRFR